MTAPKRDQEQRWRHQHKRLHKTVTVFSGFAGGVAVFTYLQDHITDWRHGVMAGALAGVLHFFAED